MNSAPAPFGAEDLQQIYKLRFESTRIYRNEVWKVLAPQFFQRYVDRQATVLDLGCGYGEFINNIQCGRKYGMDLNAAAATFLNKDVQFLQQSCSEKWSVPEQSLDVVFTSNFFEHLPNKNALSATLREAWRCLRPSGQIICMGPNIKYVPGKYWDFWDHHLPLTELSLKEALETNGLEVTTCYSKFLPYTMVNARRYPLVFVALYARLPLAWKIFGKQFLVVGRK